MRADINPGGNSLTTNSRSATRSVSSAKSRATTAHPHPRAPQRLPERAPTALELAANYPKLAGYTKVATIATDIHHCQEFRASVAPWPFLSDPTGSSRRTSISRNTPTPITTR